MKKMIHKATHLLLALFALCSSVVTFQSCIEPPLKLPAEDVLVDIPAIVTDMEVVWNLDIDWKHRWHYGWDEKDEELFGNISYPQPTSFEVRRHYLGEQPGGKPISYDGFTIFGNRFRRSYQFGYYDLLLWSNIDSKDGSQVLVVDESDPLSVQAFTTVTRGISRGKKDDAESRAVIALYNQPEIFYSTYPRDIYISRNKADYDYFDEEEKCWVKSINCVLNPLVYIYLVQVILINNDGRVTGTSGNAALSSVASSVDVNTGHTGMNPAMVYFNTRYKSDMTYENAPADIIGSMLTTFGMCDMASYSDAPSHQYNGSRTDLKNQLMIDLSFRNGTEKTLTFDVTDQCHTQAHGGIITVVVDCKDIEMPDVPIEEGTGSLFVPTVEDYDEVIYEIPIGY